MGNKTLKVAAGQFDPPGHLSDRAKALWASVTPSRCRSPGRLALLQSALEALDRADAARVAVAQTGMTTVTESTKAIHANPLLKIERESRQQFCKIWHELNLHFDQSIDGATGGTRLANFLAGTT